MVDRFYIGVSIVELVTRMSDAELEAISSAAHIERTARNIRRIQNGEYPPMNEEEKELARNGNKIKAIQTYRNRAGVRDANGYSSFDLKLAKDIIETYIASVNS